ncbi:hypothetical protein HY251_20040 [bacterium]|nr:hypothetical protein [bacterium]
MAEERGRSAFVALAVAAASWALAIILPCLIWPLCLDNLAPRPGNLLGLALVTLLAGSLGFMAVNRAQALALGFTEIWVRPAPWRSYLTILFAVIVARLLSEWRASKTVPPPGETTAASAPASQPAWPTRAARTIADVLELAPLWRQLVLAVEPSKIDSAPLEGSVALRRFLLVLVSLFFLHEAALRVVVDSPLTPALCRASPLAAQLVDDSVLKLEKEKDWFKPHPYLWHIHNPDRNDGVQQDNRYGYRAPDFDWPKKPGEKRVVVVGSSVVFTYGVPEETMPTLLGKDLSGRLGSKVESINAGFHSNSSQQSLVQVATRVVELEPDVVVFYVGDCDLSRDVGPGAATDPDDRSVDWQRDDSTHVPFHETTPISRWLAHRSALLAYALIHSHQLRPTTLENVFVTEEGDPLEDVIVGGGPYNGIAVLTSGRAALGLAPTAPEPTGWRKAATSKRPEDLARFHARNLEKMVVLAQHAHARTVLCSIVVKLTPKALKQFSPNEDPDVVKARVIAMRDVMNRNIRELSEKTGSLFVDLSEAIEPDDDNFDDDIHWNSKGAGIVARAIGEKIAAAGLLR